VTATFVPKCSRKNGTAIQLLEVSLKNYLFENTGQELVIRNVEMNDKANLYTIGGSLIRTAKAASSEVRLPSAILKDAYIVTINNVPFKIIL
jgi:hypothetical protein